MDELLQDFLAETNERIDQVDAELVSFEQEPNNRDVLGSIFRLVHTIKGTCGFLGLDRLQTLSHAGEHLLSRFRDGEPVTREAVSLILATIDRIKLILADLERLQAEPGGDDSDLTLPLLRYGTTDDAAPPLAQRAADRDPAPDDAAETDGRAAMPAELRTETAASHTIRVNVDVIDQLMATVSELVLTRNQLLDLARRTDDGAFKAPLQRLSNITAELQDGVMKTRMQPIAHLWRKLPRLVRDLCGELGKDVDLVLAGADTELDRQLIELIKDPLTHMIRNAIDHGVETPAERRALGKRRAGQLRISASHQGGSIHIEMSDDGRGLDYAAIRARAAARGLATEAELERMSEAQLARVIFQPGFSTAGSVSAISGRGVGMDVVKNNVEQIGGVVSVRSTQGEGTTFQLKIPLTLAILAALLVEAGGQRFAIPQAAVVEIVRAGDQPGAHRIERINGAEVLSLRNQTFPLTRLGRLLDLEEAATPSASGLIVVMRVGPHRFGVMVEAVSHAEEIVVKPLSTALRHIALFSGATILGDGAVILIIEPNAVARALGLDDSADAHPGTDDDEDGNETVQTMPLLVFKAGGDSLKAIPLSLVARLEELDATQIEGPEGRLSVRYRDGLMPLIPAAEGVVARRVGTQPTLVIHVGEQRVGLLVDAVVDIVDEPVAIELPTDAPGLIGSAIVHGRATDLIDLGSLLQIHDPGGTLSSSRNRRQRVGRRLLLVQRSPFFQALTTPALRAAGYAVDVEPELAGALARLRSGRLYAAAIVDADDFGDLAGTLDPFVENGPVVGLATDPTDPDLDLLRISGVSRILGKFDRRGLVAALDGTNVSREAA